MLCDGFFLLRLARVLEVSLSLIRDLVVGRRSRSESVRRLVVGTTSTSAIVVVAVVVVLAGCR